MTLRIVVPRRPVSVNEAYGRNPNGGVKGFYMTAVGKAYKESVRSHAFAAVRTQYWPKPEAVTACRVHLTTFNTRHDVDGCAKLTLDSLEGIVYKHDRVITEATFAKRKDDGPARVEIVVTLDRP